MDDNGIKRLTKIFNNIYNIIKVSQTGWNRHLWSYQKRQMQKSAINIETGTQFKFSDALGTKEALFPYQVLFQWWRDVNCDIYVCFVHYQKPFDIIKDDELILLLEEIDIDDKYLKIMKTTNQTANIRVDNQWTEAKSSGSGEKWFPLGFLA